MRIVASVLVALLTAQFASAQGRGLLWKVEKEGQPTSFLFGTIHIIPASQFEISEGLENALNTCDELVLEADLSDQGAVFMAMKYAQLPNGGKIDTMITYEEYALIDSALQASVGMGLAGFVSFKPFFIESLFASTVVTEDPVVIELKLTEKIKELEKPLFSLETLVEQMTLFDSIPYREQMQGLIKSLREENSLSEQYQELLDLYLKEDLDQIGTYMSTSLDDDEMLYYLLEKRNKNWIPTLNERMAKKSLLIAVGAGHLTGETGVIQLLRKQGYTLTPIR